MIIYILINIIQHSHVMNNIADKNLTLRSFASDNKLQYAKANP